MIHNQETYFRIQKIQMDSFRLKEKLVLVLRKLMKKNLISGKTQIKNKKKIKNKMRITKVNIRMENGMDKVY